MHLKAITSWAIMLVLMTTASKAAVIDSYTSATNDRFTNNGTLFEARSFNLSGIGQTSAGGWATLISPNVVVSAFHAKPDNGAVINFYPSNDSASNVVQRTVTSTNVRVGSTDLWIGVLDSNVPDTIKFYSYTDVFLTGTAPGPTVDYVVTDAGVFQDVNAFLVGRSPESFPAFQSQAIGRNRITGFAENVKFGSADNDSLIMEYDALGSSAYVTYETRFAAGDSGAPFFVESNGDLLLLGTNAFRIDNGSTPVGSGINYIGNQSSFISGFVAINAVPEPSSLFLGATAAIAGYVVNRRRKKVNATHRD